MSPFCYNRNFFNSFALLPTVVDNFPLCSVEFHQCRIAIENLLLAAPSKLASTEKNYLFLIMEIRYFFSIF